ncbi:MAG TPA: type III PLP-dependent enzyme [Candidatus Saccharimonadales bacterium]|nr:type III PLP-dependent enzyme [Candidatus Saccharimonadales bacterium]
MQDDGIKILTRLSYATPFLYLDLARVEQAYRNFTEFMPNVRVHYAMKCNPAEGILQRLQAIGSSFEIASFTELCALMRIGVHPRDVIFSNPVKVPADIRNAHNAGLDRFSFDSRAELDKLAHYAPGARAFVRIQTVAADSTVPSEGKFGIAPNKALELMGYAVKLGLKPYGIAFHVGSQMVRARAWEEPIRASGALMRELQKRDIFIEMLDMGGGFPAAHGGTIPTLATFATVIKRAVKQHLPYPAQLVIEPGRGLVGNAGVMVATVIGLAERANGNWAHLDVGAFNGMMEALESQNNLHFPLADSKNSRKKQRFNLTGPSCDSQDTIMFNVELSHNLTVGDKVFIGTAGAYTTSYASRFNGFEIPGVYYAT